MSIRKRYDFPVEGLFSKICRAAWWFWKNLHKSVNVPAILSKKYQSLTLSVNRPELFTKWKQLMVFIH